MSNASQRSGCRPLQLIQLKFCYLVLSHIASAQNKHVTIRHGQLTHEIDVHVSNENQNKFSAEWGPVALADSVEAFNRHFTTHCIHFVQSPIIAIKSA